MPWPGIDAVKQEILHERDQQALNVNNHFRTDYYLNYWNHNLEIRWAFLAHLVSRNAGYQMSDLVRLAAQGTAARVGEIVLLPITGIAGTVIDLLVAHAPAMFALLEAANFLIFRDVFPQLEAYAKAKQFPDHAIELFDMLDDHNASGDFDVDPFILDKWKTFFAGTFAVGTTPTEVEIEQHSFAQIVNEQNQIEDRLINDTTGAYLPWGVRTTARALLELFTSRGFTRLCFPLAASETSSIVNQLIVYTVQTFTSLDSRINTGRDLFTALFQQDAITRRIAAWARAHSSHNGTRVDYNPTDYDIHRISLLPGGQKYSPPLIPMDNVSGVWPSAPGDTFGFRNTHQPPVPLPAAVRSRPAASIAAWLAPFTASPPGPALRDPHDHYPEIAF